MITPDQSTVKDVHEGNSAIFSPCRNYRYVLNWGLTEEPTSQDAVFVMLNPSTADAFKLDPTLRRCANFARDLGCGQMSILNLFAFRATSPKDMKKEEDPNGPLNDHYLRSFFQSIRRSGDILICGWGTHGTHLGRNEEVKRMIREYHAPAYSLSTTKAGHPVHPLYLPGDSPLTPFAI